VVWKLRRSRVEAEEGVKEVEVRAVRPRRERARVVDIVVVAVSGNGWVCIWCSRWRRERWKW